MLPFYTRMMIKEQVAKVPDNLDFSKGPRGKVFKGERSIMDTLTVSPSSGSHPFPTTHQLEHALWISNHGKHILLHMAGSWSLEPILHNSNSVFLNMKQKRKFTLGNFMQWFLLWWLSFCLFILILAQQCFNTAAVMFLRNASQQHICFKYTAWHFVYLALTFSDDVPWEWLQLGHIVYSVRWIIGNSMFAFHSSDLWCFCLSPQKDT